MWDLEDRDNVDFLAALGIGAILGLGLALMFRPDPPTRRERLMKELKPYRKKLDRKTQQARKTVGRKAGAARVRGDELVGAGREALDSLRGDIADTMVETQVGAAQEAIRKNTKRLKG
jgi:gas vesicle protein